MLIPPLSRGGALLQIPPLSRSDGGEPKKFPHLSRSDGGGAEKFSRLRRDFHHFPRNSRIPPHNGGESWSNFPPSISDSPPLIPPLADFRMGGNSRVPPHKGGELASMPHICYTVLRTIISNPTVHRIDKNSFQITCGQ